MTKAQVLVVGAGLAGVGAAVELARAGQPVLVADRAPRAGGAIHRQPLPGRAAISSHAARWDRLIAEAQALPIDWAFETKFAGLDHTGTALLSGATNRLMRPAALVLALGAREAVRPRTGWTLPNVTTAGALQIELKTQGLAPQGRVLLAGNGPLLIAVAAQMTRLGNPPVAIVESAAPFAHPLHSLALPLSYLREAAGYMATLIRARVPILTRAEVVAIRAEGTALSVRVETPKGPRVFTVDRVGLHDGIRKNDGGVTACAAVPVLALGDCAEVLGARAALASGRAGGIALARALTNGTPRETVPSTTLVRERAAQQRLARIYAHDAMARLADLPGGTVICRCEGGTLDDLRALGPTPRVRELRLLGRFGMGPCQGRSCGEWVARASADDPGLPPPDTPLGRARWPLAPIAIADLIAATSDTGAAPLPSEGT
ncbi:MAG: FAD-dependent oxidoreductase [Paracoccaceae bacterium]|nr:FAD-dependent oxidoreductase [Paracoccaceae bacterium]